MYDLTLINQNVCNTLRKENNEIIYKGWLFFAEDTQLIENNIVVMVPNHFIKNIIEERYFNEIEELYRRELEFSQLIIKVMAEEVKDSSVKNSVGEQFTNKLDDFIELFNTHVRNIYDFIEAASINGSSFVSYTLINESFCGEEIYWKIKEFMMHRGFKVEFNRIDSCYTLNLSW